MMENQNSISNIGIVHVMYKLPLNFDFTKFLLEQKNIILELYYQKQLLRRSN